MEIPALLYVMILMILPVFHLQIFFTACVTLEHFFVGLVIVDCSATYDTVSVLKDAVNHGCCVVLANKKPLTCAYVRPSRLLVLLSDV